MARRGRSTAETQRTYALCASGCFVLLLGLVVVLLVTVGLRGPVPFFFFLLVPATIGTVWLWLQAIKAAQGEITMAKVTPAAAPLGGTVHCVVRYRPAQAFELGNVEFVLELDEHAIRRGGTSNSHFHDRIQADRKLLRGQFTTRPGIEMELSEELTVPADRPPSWRGKNNSFNWSVKIHIEVPGIRPDVKHTIPLQVKGELTAPEGG